MASPSQRPPSLRAKVRSSFSRTREPRRVSMEVPERFQGEDEEEDVTGAQQQTAGYGQQSLYGLVGGIAKGQLPAHLQMPGSMESGDESDGEAEAEGSSKQSKTPSRTGSKPSSGRSSLDEPRRSPKPEMSGHKKTKSQSKVLSSFLKPIRERSDSRSNDMMTQSQFLPPKETVEELERPASAGGMRSDAPMLDARLRAKARAQMDASTTSTSSRKVKDGAMGDGSSNAKAVVDLPKALADIFQFDEPEDIIEEYPCWYLQSVMLQGYMYITAKHVCFYAYMQKKGNAVIKSGHLSKQGKRDPRYKRYWFSLKGDVLSYFANAANPYFPSGTVDLRYAITAELAPEKGLDKSRETSTFTVTTDMRTYYFKADSITSAKEWVKQLQKVIFRTRNEGDSVKISLPLANVVDVESQPVIDMAETVRLRVIDNHETFAVDEYFFTFFSNGRSALTQLDVLTEGNEARKYAIEKDEEDMEPLRHNRTPSFQRSVSVERSRGLGASSTVPERVRSTLSPASAGGGRASPRVSGEYPRSSGEVSRTSFDRSRSSFDRRRRSMSGSRNSLQQALPPTARESSESFAASPEQGPSSPVTPGGGEIDLSASQMLTGDGAFRAPTLQMAQPKRTVSGSTVERLRRESQQLPHARTTSDERVHRSYRTQTEQTLASASRKSIETADAQRLRPAASPSAPTAPRPMRTMLATPLQYAYGLAGQVRSQSKRGLSYLGSSPKDYYNKFSGALAGGKRHYSEADGLASEDRIEDPEDDLDTTEHERRFQSHFALPDSERLVAVFYCWLHRVLPLYGKIYVGTHTLCFRSLLYGTRTKLVVPFKNILNVEKEKGFRWGYPGMVVVIRGHEELFFDFNSNGLRDDCVVTVLRGLDAIEATQESVLLTEGEKADAETAAAEHELLHMARKDGLGDPKLQFPGDLEEHELGAHTFMFDDPNASVLDFRPPKSLRITCLTIGSRGDVQPYIALCKGLKEEGHRPRIATHHGFKSWVEKHGIEFVPVEGDPAELMRICVENGMFTPSFLYEANSKFRGWLDELLTSSYEACKESDVLIESPSAMAGIHIAEALGIPYFRAFTMPWTRTRAYPHAFAVPGRKLGGQYNSRTYTFFDNLFWYMTAKQINRWRGKVLNLEPTSLDRLQPNKVPFLYNFSPSVVVPPLDFSDWVRVTGYWFLDEGEVWTPPKDLMAFIDKARKDKQKLVYIGFGSVTVSDSRLLTQQVVDAVLKADVRCILSKGWSDHFDKKDATTAEVPLPSSVFQIRSAPHDWLFKQIDAAVHHGGAGTTGASLRAGVPTVIKPFFGDQFFFATRVDDLGVGIHLKKITVNSLGKALWIATHDDRMRTKARVLGEQIRSEDGVGSAIKAIYRDLEYAKTLIKKPRREVSGDDGEEQEEEETEESWTFVEEASDVDVAGARLGDPALTLSHGQRSRGLAYTRRPSLGSMVLRPNRLT